MYMLWQHLKSQVETAEKNLAWVFQCLYAPDQYVMTYLLSLGIGKIEEEISILSVTSFWPDFVF